MNELEKLAFGVQGSFNQLWSFKLRGNDTIEISTPYSTTSSKFVSVFVTKRKDKYIVSDGGLLNSEAYESVLDYENECLLKILYHFANYYEVKKTQDKNGFKHYYKTTTSEKLIANMVYELAQFVSMCASAATVKFEDQKEIESRNTFRKKATSYIGANFQGYHPKFRASLDKDDFRSVRFSAILERKSRLNIISYVSGSTPSNFRNSIASANLNFEIASSSKYKNHIDNKIVLVNNTAEGFILNQISKQLHVLEDQIGQKVVNWSEREKLQSIIK